MGGKILEYEAKTLFRQGIELGREQGLELGREQGLELGREQGLELGREQGRAQGEAQLSLLIAKLMESDRSQDILKVTQDEEFREKLYEEYRINKRIIKTRRSTWDRRVLAMFFVISCC